MRVKDLIGRSSQEVAVIIQAYDIMRDEITDDDRKEYAKLHPGKKLDDFEAECRDKAIRALGR